MDLIAKVKGSNLRVKLSLCFLFIFEIPVIACSFYLFNSYNSSINKEIQDQNKQQLAITVANIYKNTEILLRTSEVITQNSKLRDSMAQKGNLTAQNLMDFQNIYYLNIDNLQSANPAINSISLFINNYNFPEMWPYIYHYGRLRGKGLEKATMRGSFWNVNHLQKLASNEYSTYENVVSNYSKITDSEYNYLGILEINMLSNTFFGKENIDLKDNNSLLCTINNQKKLYNIAGNNFFEANKLDKSKFTKCIAQKLIGDEGHIVFDLLGNRNTIINYKYIKEIDSYVCNVSLTQQSTKKISYIRNMIIIIAITTMIIVYLLTFFSMCLLLKKLRVIIESMRKVQEGNFDIDIPVYGNDEIGELAFHFRKMLAKIEELISDVIKKKVAVKDAEINALHYQINRHFITNTLEKVKILSDEKGQHEISKAIRSLSSITKYNMKWTTEYVALREEIEYIKSYFQIMMNLNNESNSKLIIDINDEYMEFEILKLSLQPIVENSINYGIETISNGEITISAYSEEEFFYICVLDDGIGIPKDKLDIMRDQLQIDNDDNKAASNNLYRGKFQANGNGIGLQNINKRIKLFYGDQYGVFIDSEEMKYTKVTLKLPES